MASFRLGKVLLHGVRGHLKSHLYLFKNEPNILRYVSNQHYNDLRSPISMITSKNNEQEISNTFQNLNDMTLEDALGRDSETFDKLFFQLSINIKTKNRVYKSEITRIITSVDKLKTISEHQALLLLSCCSNLLPDETSLFRMELLNKVRNILVGIIQLNVHHYNEILRCYIDSKHATVASKFIEEMSPIKPNATTYTLLLQNACEAGDMNQAAEILSNLKTAHVPITEEMLISLIEGHGKNGDNNLVQDILNIYKTLHINMSPDTEVALIKVSILNDPNFNLETILSKLISKGVVFSEKNIMDIVKCLLNKNYESVVPIAFSYLPKASLNNSSLSPYLQSVCTHLVHRGYGRTIFELIKKLQVPDFTTTDHSSFGKTYLKDCVKASMPVSNLKDIALQLINSGYNKYALHIIYHVASIMDKVDVALEILHTLKDQGSLIRCHYFWPLFLNAARNEGETGIFDVLSKMKTFGVQIDKETFLDYVLPYLNIASPQSTIKKFHNHGIATSLVLTPILLTLLKMNNVKEAAILCELYESSVNCEALVVPLTLALRNTGDYESVSIILSRFQHQQNKTRKDSIGAFLEMLTLGRKWKSDLNNLNSITKALKSARITVTDSIIDSCIQHIEKNDNDALKELPDIKNNLVALKSGPGRIVTDHSYIPHPRDMELHALENHLIELESKGMNTRGVLRKLLQTYCRTGDVVKAKDIIAKCKAENVPMSPGMKTSILEIYVKSKDLESAEKIWMEIRRNDSKFNIDAYKIVDYANLLLNNERITEAFNILEGHASKNNLKGGKYLETNCWRLLNSLAATGNVQHTQKMFALLTGRGYCDVTNIILGPLVRVHVNSSNIIGAVEEMKKCSSKYKKLPLKHEVLCHLLQEANKLPEDKHAQECKALISDIVNLDRQLHNTMSSQLTIVSALAETKLKAQLRRVLLDSSMCITQEAFLKQCKKFGNENKLDILEVLAESVEGIRNINSDDIYEIIMNVHSINSNCSGALDLWIRMQEKNKIPSENTVKLIYSMLKSHKMNIPNGMLSYLSDKMKQSIT